MACPFTFAIRSSGRSGVIECCKGDRVVTIDWEMSGSAEVDIALAPADFRKWSCGDVMSREMQLKILAALRAWLEEQGIRSDVARPSTTAPDSRCVKVGCQTPALTGIAYCSLHYDDTLLR